jgi:hypothetical protein
MIDWCLTCQFEDYDGSEEPCINCVSDTEVEGNAKPTEYFPKKPPKPITHADRIRAMTDEELADWFSIYCCRNKTYDAHCETFGNCEACWLDWLKEEVSNG